MSENDNDVKVIVNPQNFNNKMLQESDIKSILTKYDIDDNIVNLDIYQKHLYINLIREKILKIWVIM